MADMVQTLKQEEIKILDRVAIYCMRYNPVRQLTNGKQSEMEDWTTEEIGPRPRYVQERLAQTFVQYVCVRVVDFNLARRPRPTRPKRRFTLFYP